MPKISAYPAGAPLQVSDKFVIARGGQNYYILGSEFLPQAGGMRNGKISVTVAGNNLTVALKTLSGADPSASNPVLANFGGVWRAISAPLSVTKNAGTNWGNAGGSALANKEVDWFAYLGYNAIDGIVIAFSRYPGGCIYSNFSTTSTNEKYAAISTITSAAASDEYMVIGRFAATLGVSPGYTWSVPTFTAANLIQRPIYETRWLDWNSAGTNLTDGAAVITAKYKTLVNTYKYHWDWKFGAGSAVGAAPNITMPWTNALVSTSNSMPCGVAEFYDSGTASYPGQPLMTTGGNTMYPVCLGAAGTYAVQTLLANNVPFTWTTNDEMMANGEVPY